METHKPIYWYQGLFLQPQHFQQYDLYLQSLVEPLRNVNAPFPWGLKSIKISEASLKNNVFELVSGEFFLKDGTWISIPGNAVAPSRVFHVDGLETGKPLRLYVGVHNWNWTDSNVTVVTQPSKMATAETRFVAPEDAEEIRDLHQGGRSAQVKTMQYLLKILREDELDNYPDYRVLPVAEIDYSDGTLSISERYIPPVLSIDSSPALKRLAHQTIDRIVSRCRKLEEYKNPRGIQSSQVEMSYVVYLLALRSLSRFVPILYHLSEAGTVHPWEVYGVLRSVVGELSVYTDRIDSLGQVAGGASLVPAYDHEEIHHCFSEVSILIGELLETLVIGPESIIHLRRKNGFFKAEIPSDILSETNSFYLVLQTAETKQKVLDTMQNIAKFGSVSVMKNLIERALPGLPLEYTLTPPPGLPKRPNSYYFVLDQSHAQWIEIRKTRSVCLFWHQAPNDTVVELVVMRK